MARTGHIALVIAGGFPSWLARREAFREAGHSRDGRFSGKIGPGVGVLSTSKVGDAGTPPAASGLWVCAIPAAAVGSRACGLPDGHGLAMRLRGRDNPARQSGNGRA
jgi:hypothetical protein